MLDFVFAHSNFLQNINWIVTYSVLICISAFFVYRCFFPSIYREIKSFISNRKIIFILLLLFCAISAILVKGIPIREGYDNYHGIAINVFCKSYKEIVSAIIISGLNQLFGYRMESNFILNYFLAIGCASILSGIIYLRFKNMAGSFLAFVLLLLSPASLILVKTISSAHVNLFFFLLTLFLLMLFSYFLKEKRQGSLFLFAVLSLLLPLMNNVRQEYLFFLFPFVLESVYLAVKSGFIAKNRVPVICSMAVSFALFILFNLFQLSLSHHNYPGNYIDVFCIFSKIKFSFMNADINFLFGITALASVLFLVMRKKYFFSFALFFWLLLSSNIYLSVLASRKFTLHFLRHELYLSIPYIISFSIIVMQLPGIMKHLYRPAKTCLFGIIIAAYIMFSFYSLQQTNGELRTTDKVLQFFYKEVPKLPKNRILIGPAIKGFYSGTVFTYLTSMYLRRFRRLTFTSLTDGNINVKPDSYLLYYPEICDLSMYAYKNETNCQQFRSYLGKSIAVTNFIHKYNCVELPTEDEILLTTGFYEPSKEFFNSYRERPQ